MDILQHLVKESGGRLDIFVVLREDRRETLLQGGAATSLQWAYLSPAGAERHARSLEGPWTAGRVERYAIVLHNDAPTILGPVHEREPVTLDFLRGCLAGAVITPAWRRML